jgi:cathepsin L
MNKSLIAALIVLGVASVYLYSLENTTSEVYSFEQYKHDFGKRYTKEGEEQYRKNIFLRNLIAIQEHNANPKNTYTMGVNQFTDLSQAEFEAIYLTLQVPKRSINTVELTSNTPNGDIDWQASGKVSAVKNQGSCGSCWAFSATASIESANLLAGKNVDLSEQQLVDCSREYGN